MSECRRPECSLRHSASTVSKDERSCLQLQQRQKGKAPEAVESRNNRKNRSSKTADITETAEKLKFQNNRMSPGSYDPGGHRGGERRPAGPALSCLHGFGQMTGTRQRMRSLQRKERKMQGSGRAIEEDAKAEMPVLPAAYAPESAGKAP